jgi:uncharacterized protein (TIGR01777 family)
MGNRVLITGGSGLIGSSLAPMLLDRGYEVAILSRNPKPSDRIKSYFWDIDKGIIDEAAFLGTKNIIHLAGAGIAEKKWTGGRKKEITQSRTNSIRLIYKYLKENSYGVKSCISSGGIGFYGDRGEDWMVETSPAGIGFLSESCIEWEKAVFEGENLGLRIAQLRVGMVLSRKGGGLKPLETLTSLFLGSALGSGIQYISWIHLSDLCRTFIKAIETDSFTGIYNAVAPLPEINKEFSLELAKAMHKITFLPNVPEFVLKAFLGEMAAVILDSTRVSNKKLESSGFEFQFKTLQKAFQNLYAD